MATNETLNQRPRKALRGLFQRTDAPSEETQAVNSASESVKMESSEQFIEKKLEKKPEHRKDSVVESVILGNSDVIANAVKVSEASNARETGSTAFVDVAQFDAQFETSKRQRNNWNERDYLGILNKIDRAQTEAFLLKGKLLFELKERFETNQTGWKSFCADDLGMNYTTANQYIRVATEFSHFAKTNQSFGFEHFKALLPLPTESREEIISQNAGASVKKIRDIVKIRVENASFLEKQQPAPSSPSFVKLLNSLKGLKATLALHTNTSPTLNVDAAALNFATLPQDSKWQLMAACQDVSDELANLALRLSGRKPQLGFDPGLFSINDASFPGDSSFGTKQSEMSEETIV
jgi:hypothetical protein